MLGPVDPRGHRLQKIAGASNDFSCVRKLRLIFPFSGAPDSFCLHFVHSPLFPRMWSYFGWERQGAFFAPGRSMGRQVSSPHPGSLANPHESPGTRPPLSLLSRPPVPLYLCSWAPLLTTSSASPNPTQPSMSSYHPSMSSP